MRCLVSAKTGLGIPRTAGICWSRIPPPEGDRDAPLQALIIDSWFDNPTSASCLLVRVKQRHPAVAATRSRSCPRAQHQADSIGCLHAEEDRAPTPGAGEVGFLIAGIKEIDGAPVGDTVVPKRRRAPTPSLPGFRRSAAGLRGLFPVSSDDYEDLRDALRKLRLNDSSLFYEPETSQAWASASAAASSACCTWRSSRSAWSASTTST
jgi:GTP-binding protein LepA